MCGSPWAVEGLIQEQEELVGMDDCCTLPECCLALRADFLGVTRLGAVRVVKDK